METSKPYWQTLKSIGGIGLMGTIFYFYQEKEKIYKFIKSFFETNPDQIIQRDYDTYLNFLKKSKQCTMNISLLKSEKDIVCCKVPVSIKSIQENFPLVLKLKNYQNEEDWRMIEDNYNPKLNENVIKNFILCFNYIDSYPIYYPLEIYQVCHERDHQFLKSRCLEVLVVNYPLIDVAKFLCLYDKKDFRFVIHKIRQRIDTIPIKDLSGFEKEDIDSIINVSNFQKKIKIHQLIDLKMIGPDIDLNPYIKKFDIQDFLMNYSIYMKDEVQFFYHYLSISFKDEIEISKSNLYKNVILNTISLGFSYFLIYKGYNYLFNEKEHHFNKLMEQKLFFIILNIIPLRKLIPLIYLFMGKYHNTHHLTFSSYFYPPYDHPMKSLMPFQSFKKITWKDCSISFLKTILFESYLPEFY